MDVELTEDLQARRLQSVLAELRAAWTPAELCALLLDLEENKHAIDPDPARHDMGHLRCDRAGKCDCGADVGRRVGQVTADARNGAGSRW